MQPARLRGAGRGRAIRGHNPGTRRGRLRWSCPWLLAAAAVAASHAQVNLPDAPAPRNELVAEAGSDSDSAIVEFVALGEGEGQETFPPAAPERRLPGSRIPGLGPNFVPPPGWCRARACVQGAPESSCCEPTHDVFSNYLRQNAIVAYTPRQLGLLAFRGVANPFNLLTIGGTSAITVATDSHSPYGPGMEGWAKLSGVSLTQDMTGEFVGTFLIPSIDHQDPHFHRMPNAPMRWRILHCAYQIFWTQNVKGKGMVNYSTIVGTMIDEAVDVSYVPYQKLGWGPAAERVASSWVSDPISNYVTEFLPQIASHINLKAVFVQRIIDRVALENGGS